ncbi:release factor glutamine methyltransferase [Clostridium collagenovorans DSM 3089]|uniref:Release factor glutamine methyltransferase n=1 Tax=Clostridium collagenovorans DSM 3089 TaxID=1121306 RepID=A0A1M5W2W5_9CLOT|nr:peptide chain release factor N(5)-glutamine methyltransferase [Clostridium collagenovorans]SHH81929.1 release factor glutamine methyltransferase [Clostridium collagenovorans DSM 3089]
MNIGEALIKSNFTLKDAEIENYILDSQLLMCKVLNKDKMFILMNREEELSKSQEEEFFKLVELRRKKMPTKYILGKTEFMGLDILIKPGVLIPRADTEILVEEAIKIIKENSYLKVCDLCSGSGAIGVAICSFLKDITLNSYDIDEVALDVTERNIFNLKLEQRAKVQYSDLLQKAIEDKESFDMIVSNPPYIRKDVIPTLMEDVKDYEPYIALCGGEDGLNFYRTITTQSLKVLKKGGALAYEIGHDQKDDVISILKENGFESIYALQDFSGLDRVVIGFLPK